MSQDDWKAEFDLLPQDIKERIESIASEHDRKLVGIFKQVKTLTQFHPDVCEQEDSYTLATDIIEGKLTRQRDFLKNPNLLGKITEIVQQTGVKGEALPIKAIIIVCVGKLTVNRRPTSTNLHPEDTSSIGKDYVVQHVSKIAFYNDWDRYDNPTPTVVTYGQKKSKLGKKKGNKAEMKSVFKEITEDSIVYIKDASEDFLNGDDFKALLEDDVKISKTVDGKAERIGFQKPVLIVTTADTQTGYQILRRLPSLSFDGTADQTKKIMDSQLEEDCNIIERPTIPINEVREYFYDLDKVMVDLNDVKDYIKEKTPSYYETIMRTLHSRLLDYIKFSATLYQKQREYIGGSVIEGTEQKIMFIKATVQDVDIGFEIFDYIYKDKFANISTLNSRQRKIHKKLRDNLNQFYSASDIQVWKESEGVGNTTTYEDLQKIMRADPCIRTSGTYPKEFGYTKDKENEEIDINLKEFFSKNREA